MGRPTRYKKEFDEEVYKLCLLGATDDDIADFFGVTDRTIDRWKIKHKGFCRSLKRGKIQADAQVAERLFKRACGYEHPETKFFVVSQPGPNSGSEIEERETVKHYPPDTAAAFIWLKNRAGWKDKQQHEHEAGSTLKQLIEHLKSRNGSQSTDN